MTVEQLINRLSLVTDKTKKVLIYNHREDIFEEAERLYVHEDGDVEISS